MMFVRKWLMLIWLLGCGDDDGGEGARPSGAAASCARGCARAAAANCRNQPSDCQQQCEAQIAATPAGCIGAINAYASCANTAVWSCDSDGVAEATSCGAQLASWLACANPVADSGARDATVQSDAGTPGPVDAGSDAGSDASADAGAGLSCVIAASDLQCDQCLKQQCCETFSACTGQCVQLLACWQSCAETDDACPDACTAQLPGGAPGVQQIYDCMARDCALACEVELGG
ncbi:MAG TPA: hypothetical protein VFX59_25620 [Polyangiales bacterium]|nr:hypothetical protein [Polyangiales bacterium]